MPSSAEEWGWGGELGLWDGEPGAPEWQCAAMIVNIACACEGALRLGVTWGGKTHPKLEVAPLHGFRPRTEWKE